MFFLGMSPPLFDSPQLLSVTSPMHIIVPFDPRVMHTAFLFPNSSMISSWFVAAEVFDDLRVHLVWIAHDPWYVLRDIVDVCPEHLGRWIQRRCICAQLSWGNLWKRASLPSECIFRTLYLTATVLVATPTVTESTCTIEDDGVFWATSTTRCVEPTTLSYVSIKLIRTNTFRTVELTPFKQTTSFPRVSICARPTLRPTLRKTNIVPTAVL